MAHHYNFYQALGLSRDSATEEIRAELQRRLDALQAEGVPHRDAHYQQTQVAAAILGEEGRRSRYDARLDDPSAPTITIPALRTLAATGFFPEEAPGAHAAPSPTPHGYPVPSFAPQSQATAPAPASAPREPQPVLPFLPETLTMPSSAKVMVWGILVGGVASFVRFLVCFLAELAHFSTVFPEILLMGALGALGGLALLVWSVAVRDHRSPFAILAASVILTLTSFSASLSVYESWLGTFLFAVAAIAFLIVVVCSLVTSTREWYAGKDAEEIAREQEQRAQQAAQQAQQPSQPQHSQSS